MKHILAVLLFAFAAGPASAQDARTFAPFAYAPTVGTSQSQVVPANPIRKKLVFFNPNNTVKVAVCLPATRTSNGASISCAVNGAGSITLLPYGSFEIDAAAPGNQGMAMGSAWNGIADTPSSALSIFEME